MFVAFVVAAVELEEVAVEEQQRFSSSLLFLPMVQQCDV